MIDLLIFQIIQYQPTHGKRSLLERYTLLLEFSVLLLGSTITLSFPMHLRARSFRLLLSLLTWAPLLSFLINFEARAVIMHLLITKRETLEKDLTSLLHFTKRNHTLNNLALSVTLLVSLSFDTSSAEKVGRSLFKLPVC